MDFQSDKGFSDNTDMIEMLTVTVFVSSLSSQIKINTLHYIFTTVSKI